MVLEHNKIEQSIIRTLLYSDIFNFPLSKEEVWQFLISKKKVSREAFETTLAELTSRHPKKVIRKDGYYCLSGNEKILKERKKNLSEVTKKMQIANKSAFYLSYIPTIYCIGISGGVAMGNVKPEDDIDFFIITKKHTLFVTRLWVLALLELLQLRRGRNEKNPANKICVNLLIEETALFWPAANQDLYTAHEIVQMKPLFERQEMYTKFLMANSWTKKFLPNATNYSAVIVGASWRRSYISLAIASFFLSLRPLEILIRKVQQFSINKYRTKETVLHNFLAFHPYDYRSQSLRLLRKKSQLLGLLTKE